MSIIRVGLSQSKSFADGYDAIFGKKKKETSAPAKKEKKVEKKAVKKDKPVKAKAEKKPAKAKASSSKAKPAKTKKK